MVGIVATVCGKVEGHGETFLTRREVAAVESVRLCGSREAGVLADSPGTEGIHGAVRATEEGRQTRHIVEVLEALKVGFCIY